MSASQQNKMPLMWLLGYAGLIPFYGLLLFIVFDIEVSNINMKLSMAQYAAIIVSFLGAIHWGHVVQHSVQLDEKGRNLRLFWSVIPSIIAWFLLFVPEYYTLYGFAVLVVSVYLVDTFGLNDQLNQQYLKLRTHLSIAVTVALLIAAVN